RSPCPAFMTPRGCTARGSSAQDSLKKERPRPRGAFERGFVSQEGNKLVYEEERGAVTDPPRRDGAFLPEEKTMNVIGCYLAIAHAPIPGPVTDELHPILCEISGKHYVPVFHNRLLLELEVPKMDEHPFQTIRIKKESFLEQARQYYGVVLNPRKDPG